LKNTWVGDSDLNGVFDSGDLVAVFSSAKYETGDAATWGQGDWNGDQKFDSGDLVEAFSNAGYEAGERPGGPNPAAAVPEPSTLVLLLMGGLLAIRRVRR
ncbi:MAG: PEP-CTERM sorting domain-containing protein, partial [Planctomycetaceae bacterium]|nr:PEP-CTERM sorting domain-containing protein [Planctomycetaceae bacterium]